MVDEFGVTRVATEFRVGNLVPASEVELESSTLENIMYFALAIACKWRQDGKMVFQTHPGSARAGRAGRCSPCFGMLASSTCEDVVEG